MNFSELVAPNGLFSDGDWIEKKDQDENGTVRLIQLADIGACFFKDKSAKFVTEAKAKELNCTYLQKGDILIARLPDPLGRACIFPLDGKYITAVDVAIVRISRSDINPKYVMYMINSPGFRNDIKHYESGTTRKRISRKNLDKIQFNIPPLPEQEHIISRIEELFSQLDASVAELKTAKERLKVYRQAVLKEAFSKFDGSIEKTISSVCENIVDCPHSTPKWVQKGKLCLRTTNFKPGYLNLSEKNYVSEETFCERISRLAPKPGDVLFSREGAILGIACIIPDGLEVCMGQRMMLLRPSEDLLNKYLMYYLNSPKARTLIIENVGGTASPHINVGDIKNFTIPIIPFAQQQSVVAEIESRLSVCDNIEKTVGTALQQAEALRQSILKKVFEGGL